MRPLIFHFQQQVDHPDRESIKKKADTNNAIDQMDLTDIYGTFYPTTESTFSSAHFLRQSIC